MSFKESENELVLEITSKKKAMLNILDDIVYKVMTLRILIAEKGEIYKNNRWDDEN